MTSKEAQNIILKHIDDLDLIFDEELQKALSKINDELKVLELLKSNCYNKEKHIRHMSDPEGEPFLLISFSIEGEENIKKVEDWYIEAWYNE